MVCQSRLVVGVNWIVTLTLGFSETIDQLAMAQCSLVWSCVEERGWLCLENGIGF